MSRPCSPFSPRTTSWPALIQKALYSALYLTQPMIPRLRNRLLRFSFVPLRIVSHIISSSFATSHFYPHLSLHTPTHLFNIHKLRETTLLPLFRRLPTIVHASAPPTAFFIPCLVTVFLLYHNPSPPDVPSTPDNVPTAHLRALIGVVILTRRSGKRLSRALEGGSYRLRGATGWASQVWVMMTWVPGWDSKRTA